MIMSRQREEARPSPPTLLTRPKHASNEENSSPGPTSTGQLQYFYVKFVK